MENNFFQIHWDKFLKFDEMEYNSFKFKMRPVLFYVNYPSKFQQ